MIRGKHLQQIPLVAAPVQADATHGASDQVVLRLSHLQGIDVFLLVDHAGIEQELVGGDGEQRLGELPDRGNQEVLDVLGCQHQEGDSLSGP